jgi:AbrB family looped-hinge helix DNA binding protein
MATATLTSKGQITIPLDVRERLKLEAGTRIEFVEGTNGEFLIRPAVADVRSLKGLLRKPAQPVSIDDMKTAIRLRGAGR